MAGVHTLRAIVVEGFGAHSKSIIDSGVIITTQLITKSVENSTAEIEKQAVVKNLDQILEREVELGCFVKVGEDQYKIGDVELLKSSFDEKTGELTPDPTDVNKQLIKVNKQLMNLTEQLVDVNKQLEDIKKSQKESSVFNLDVEKLTSSQRDHLQKKLNEVRRKKSK